MGSHRVPSSVGSMAGPGNHEVTANSIEYPDGSVQVGKISFNRNIVLGKGCEGTFVFK